MICRTWHGWTTEANAEVYEHFLRSEVFPGIMQRKISGFQAIDLLKRSVSDEVEFVTLMWFDSIESVQRFAGPNYEMAVVPSKAQELLARFDARSAHYTVTERQST